MDSLILTLKDCIKHGMDKISGTKRYNIPKKPWLSKSLLICIRKRDKMRYKINQGIGGNFLKIRYSIYNRTLCRVLRNSEKMYYTNRINNSNNGTKETWKSIYDIIGRGKGEGIFPQIKNLKVDELNVKVSNYTEMGDIFNTYFSNMGGAVSDVSNHYSEHVGNITSIFLNPTDPCELEKVIDTLSNSKAKDLDGISNWILKKSKFKLIHILCHIINICISTGIFPNCLKRAKIILKYKGGDRNSIGNYRPISILSPIGKVLEKIIHIRLLKFFTKNHFLSERQFGFQMGKSAEDAVASVTEYIRGALEKQDLVGGISLDLSKAFDRITHNILLNKLSNAGIRGMALNLCKDFLSNRRQCVLIQGALSKDVIVRKGVPQGSILGPLFFIVYLNDLPDCVVKESMFLYADDNLILVRSKSPKEIQIMLQNIINKVQHWLNVNKMVINSNKSNLIIFMSPSISREIKNEIKLIKLNIDGTCIEPVNRIKYLGVVFDCYLNWNEHILGLRNNLAVLVPIMYRIRRIFNKKVLMAVYYGLLLSRLFYCLHSYGSTAKVRMDILHIFQKKIIKIINFKQPRDSSVSIFVNEGIMNIYQLYCYKILKVWINYKQGKISIIGLNFNRARLNPYPLRGIGKYYEEKRYINKYGFGAIVSRLPRLINVMVKEGFNPEEDFSGKHIVKRVLSSWVFKLNWRTIWNCTF